MRPVRRLLVVAGTIVALTAVAPSALAAASPCGGELHATKDWTTEPYTGAVGDYCTGAACPRSCSLGRSGPTLGSCGPHSSRADHPRATMCDVLHGVVRGCRPATRDALPGCIGASRPRSFAGPW